MNQAYRDGFITRRFVIPKYVLEHREKKLDKVLFDKYKFIEAINNSENIFQVQSLSIFLMLMLCGGMRPSDLVNYETNTLENFVNFNHYNDEKDLFVSIRSSIYRNLNESYNDKYEFILPELNLNKNIYIYNSYFKK